VPYLSERYQEQNNSGPAAVNRTGTFDAAGVAQRLAGRVLGQPAAVTALREALVLAQAGFHDRERPLAALLLVGPTGVGKTESVRRLAAELRGGPDDLCRVDMGQLAQEHYAASLAGAPPGYAGSREASTVFDVPAIEGTPFTPGIVLFDEVEKAHPVVLRALLGLLDRGTLTLASGERTISFRNAFVFLTSNLGSAELARHRGAPWRRRLDALPGRSLLDLVPGRVPGRSPGRVPGRSPLARRAAAVIDRAVRGFFDPEFLNRLDAVVHFDAITAATARDIAALRLADVAARLARRDVHLEVGAGVADALAGSGFDPVYGARGLGRVVRRELLVPVAELLVEHRAHGSGRLHVRVTASPSGALEIRPTRGPSPGR
jgi:ATP-dependent Clp protease ATP-binding subunit ClpA